MDLVDYGCLHLNQQTIHPLVIKFVRRSGEILGIVGQDPNVSKSNWSNFDTFRFFLY